MLYNFCPKCGSRLIKKSDLEGFLRLICSKCNFIFYQNSKPTATAVIIDNNNVLLAKRKYEPKKDFWNLPGGFLEYGEDPIKGVKREIKEELCVNIKVLDILGIFIDKYPYFKDNLYTLNIIYLTKIIQGTLKPCSDTKELKWFAYNKLPKKIAFKNDKQGLNTWIKKYID